MRRDGGKRWMARSHARWSFHYTPRQVPGNSAAANDCRSAWWQRPSVAEKTNSLAARRKGTQTSDSLLSVTDRASRDATCLQLASLCVVTVLLLG